MRDFSDNVLPHPTRHRHEGGDGQDGKSARRRRAERADARVARASRIREAVAAFRGRLDHDTRLQLAAGLGQTIYAPPTPKRGWLTQILVQANISMPEEHTKRLERYVVKPGNKAPSPKTLAAKPGPYLRIAEALADAKGLDSDAVVDDLFKDTQFGEVEHASAGDTLEPYLPLYRMLQALADAAAQESGAEAYLRDLARWRWITAADACRRGLNVSTFGIMGVRVRETPGETDPAGGAMIPALSRVWLPDTNTFAPDPDEPEFFEQRLDLLPRLALLEDRDRHTFELDRGAGVEQFLDGNDGTYFPEVELLEARVHLVDTVWLVLCPSGAQGDVRPHLARFYEQRTVGTCLIGGVRTDFEDVTAPPAAAVVDKTLPPARAETRVHAGFCPLEDVHFSASAILDDPALEAALAPRDIALIPLTPASVARVLGYPIELDGDGHVEVSAFTFAPFRTWAAFIESQIRDSGVLFDTDRQMKRSLINHVSALRERLEREVDLLREEAYRNQEQVIERLAAPLSDDDGGDDNDDNDDNEEREP